MSGKLASFFLSLALIGWQVFDIVKGKASVLTWVLLGIFSLGALFELGAVLEGNGTATQNGAENNAVESNEAPAQKVTA